MQSPRFATHFPNLLNQHNLNSITYAFMRDVPLYVMPIGRSLRRDGVFSVEIEPNSDNRHQILSILASIKGGDDYNSYVERTECRKENYYSLREMLSDAINMIAKSIASDGRAVYELMWDEENRAYRLYPITHFHLHRAFGRYIQLIPKSDRELWGTRYVIVRSKYVWEVCIPSKLGGRRRFRRTLKRLIRSNTGIPTFSQSVNFDFQKHTQEKALYYAKITAPWGWNQGDFSGEKWTEIYQFYRELQFKWAQALVREHALKEINGLLSRLKIRSVIVVNGLPTSSEIIKIRQRMLDGEISVLDALEECKI